MDGLNAELEDLVSFPSEGVTECLHCDNMNYGKIDNPNVLDMWLDHYRTRHPKLYMLLIDGLPLTESIKAPRTLPYDPYVIPVASIDSKSYQGDYPTVLLGTQICNDAKHLDRWWKALLALDYPKDKLKLYVIEDYSEDDTFRILEGYQKNSPFAEFALVKSQDLPTIKLRERQFWDRKPSWVNGGVNLWRVNEWNGWYNNIWFGAILKGKADLFWQVHGDILAHPETLKSYVAIYSAYPDAGSVGSGGMTRGGQTGNPWIWKVPNYQQLYRENQSSGGGSVVRLCSSSEIKSLPDLCRCAFVGGCFSINRKAIGAGARFGNWNEETMTPFAVQLEMAGLHSYCDYTTPFVHINRDESEQVIPKRSMSARYVKMLKEAYSKL